MTANKKMIVSPARRIFRAISFGVFCREAPSTKRIMRSRNVSPGLEVMRTLISSESTRVPPVTAERSPPDSRITGADSPVIADSSTDATPSMTSPSPGMNSPAATTTVSPERSLELAIVSIDPSPHKRRASVSARALRSVSACALPRPSAMASAKFAKTTVNHSHTVIWSPQPKLPMCCRCSVIAASENLSGKHLQVLENRTQTERRKKCERAHNQNGGNEQSCEQRAGHGERPGRRRSDLFFRQVPGDGKYGDMHEEAAQHHGYRSTGVVPHGIAVQAAEGGAIVAHHRGITVEDL